MYTREFVSSFLFDVTGMQRRQGQAVPTTPRRISLRRGATSLEYVLLISVILVLVIILMRDKDSQVWGAVGVMQSVYELIAGMVSWPFL